MQSVHTHQAHAKELRALEAVLAEQLSATRMRVAQLDARSVAQSAGASHSDSVSAYGLPPATPLVRERVQLSAHAVSPQQAYLRTPQGKPIEYVRERECVCMCVCVCVCVYACV
jgi:hypothetical protein